MYSKMSLPIGVGELWPYIHSLTFNSILQAVYRLPPIFVWCHLNRDLMLNLVREQNARWSEYQRRPLSTIFKYG